MQKKLENAVDTDEENNSNDEDMGEEDEQRGSLQLRSFARRDERQGLSHIRSAAFGLWGKLTYIPNSLISNSSKLIDNMNTSIKQKQKVLKIRPPRFTSFTLELEAYNLKKAISLEILNEINQSSALFERETILKLFVMGRYVLIFTAKRLICVEQEENLSSSITMQPTMSADSLRRRISQQNLSVGINDLRNSADSLRRHFS